MVLTGDDLLALKDAKCLLENPSFALSVINFFGKAVEKILYDELPDKARNFITRITSVRLISEQIQLVPSTNCFIRLLKSFGNK
jgi:hypothetical protein